MYIDYKLMNFLCYQSFSDLIKSFVRKPLYPPSPSPPPIAWLKGGTNYEATSWGYFHKIYLILTENNSREVFKMLFCRRKTTTLYLNKFQKFKHFLWFLPHLQYQKDILIKISETIVAKRKPQLTQIKD